MTIYQQIHPQVAAFTGQSYNGKCIQSATLPIMSKVTGNTWKLFSMSTSQLTGHIGGIPTRIAKNIPQAWLTAAPPRYLIDSVVTLCNQHQIITCQVSVQEAIQQQANLGWKQLLYGWITGAWKVLFNAKAPLINSNSFFSKIIHHRWMVLLTIWQIRNMHLHPSHDNLTDCTQLYAIVENIFHMVQTDPTLSTLLSYTTIDQIMFGKSGNGSNKAPHTYMHIKKEPKSEQH